MGSTLIVTTEYLPPISTYMMMQFCDDIIIEVHENYQKKSYRNRATLMGPNGKTTLSVPLTKGKNNQQSIKDVRIAYDTPWIAKHLHTIRTAYGNAPYFEHYYGIIEDVLTREYEHLFDLNTELFVVLSHSMGLKKDISYTEAYRKVYEHEVMDLRDRARSKQLREKLAFSTYHQVFEEKLGFVSDLSALDLLMCTGPESMLYL